MGQSRRLIKQTPIPHAGGVINEIDWPGAFTGCKIIAPARIRAIEMQNAGTLFLRRATGQIGASQRATVMGQPRFGKKCRQPVTCRVGKPGLYGAQIMARGR